MFLSCTYVCVVCYVDPAGRDEGTSALKRKSIEDDNRVKKRLNLDTIDEASSPVAQAKISKRKQPAENTRGKRVKRAEYEGDSEEEEEEEEDDDAQEEDAEQDNEEEEQEESDEAYPKSSQRSWLSKPQPSICRLTVMCVCVCVSSLQ